MNLCSPTLLSSSGYSCAAKLVFNEKQIHIYHAATIPYQSLEDGNIHYDTVRTHEDFHVWNSAGEQAYSKLLLLFKLQIDETEHSLAFVQDYTPITSNDLTDDDRATGFQRFSLGGMDYTRFIFAKHFIRGAFMVNTDDLHGNHYFLNDLVDPDMYLRLRG